MALTTNRYLALFLLLIAASICYAVGFLVGVVFFIAAGVVLESVFWFKLIFGRKRR